MLAISLTNLFYSQYFYILFKNILVGFLIKIYLSMEVKNLNFLSLRKKNIFFNLKSILVYIKPFWFLLNKWVQLWDAKEEIKILLQCFVYDSVQTVS